MPYVHCLTSQVLDAGAEEAFKAAVASALAETAGKPENYLFVAVESGKTLFVRGRRAPGAVLHVSLVGTLGKGQKKELTTRLCGISQEVIGVTGDNVYIIFAEVAGENWGWNGATFG